MLSRLRGHLAVAIVVTVASAALAGGCGGDDDGGNASSPTAATTQSTAEPTVSVPGGQATEAPQTPGAGASPRPGVATPGTGMLLVADAAGRQILTDEAGFTLYVFDRDEPGQSNCNGVCASAWPPLLTAGPPPASPGLTGAIATITRRDNALQVTYNGRPLYRFIQDEQPGQANGDGNSGAWHVATP